jgi:hypothetical protein
VEPTRSEPTRVESTTLGVAADWSGELEGMGGGMAAAQGARVRRAAQSGGPTAVGTHRPLLRQKSSIVNT